MDGAHRSEPTAILCASRSRGEEEEAADWEAGGGTGGVVSWRLKGSTTGGPNEAPSLVAVAGPFVAWGRKH